jgi:hypothetical protein
MIVIGLVSLLLATLEHRRDLNALNEEGRHSLARVLAALISLLGLLALFFVLFRQ